MTDHNDLKINDLENNMANIQKDVKEFKDDFKEFKNDFKSDFQAFKTHLDEKFVSKADFSPVQKIVYGMVGTILTTILLAFIYQIIIK